jgi:hypothetical protein
LLCSTCHDNDGLHILVAQIGPFQSLHTAHRTPDDARHRADANVVEHKFVETARVSLGLHEERGALCRKAISPNIITNGGDGKLAAPRSSRRIVVDIREWAR